EGRIAWEFRNHLLAFLVSEEIEAVAIEQPLNTNQRRKKLVHDHGAEWAGVKRYEETGVTTMATIFRLYSLVSHAVEICSRLNIPLYMVRPDDWRTAFMGVNRAPKGCADSRAWLKERARQQCVRLGIEVKNADQTDAVGVCW